MKMRQQITLIIKIIELESENFKNCGTTGKLINAYNNNLNNIKAVRNNNITKKNFKKLV